MKSIRSFIEGKIHRTESEDRLSVEDSAAHEKFGGSDGVLVGPKGRVAFYERGMTIADGSDIAYEEIERVVSTPAPGSLRFVDIILADGRTKRLESSAIGGEVVHATLRWIGNTRLRRKIAE